MMQQENRVSNAHIKRKCNSIKPNNENKENIEFD